MPLPKPTTREIPDTSTTCITSKDGVARLHNEFETSRDLGYHIHKAIGFRDTGIVDGIIHLEMTRDDYARHLVKLKGDNCYDFI